MVVIVVEEQQVAEVQVVVEQVQERQEQVAQELADKVLLVEMEQVHLTFQAVAVVEQEQLVQLQLQL
jgi:2'-5' RNA ligase